MRVISALACSILVAVLMEPLLAPSAARRSALDWRGGSQISSQPRTRPAMRATPKPSKMRPTSSANWRSPEALSWAAAFSVNLFRSY
jgi:hypothetical protein